MTEYTGGMLALVPDNYAALAVDGGEPPEQLHLTLLYLGDNVTDWPEGQAAQLRELVAASAPALDPVDARVIGHAVLNPDGGADGETEPCAVYLVGDAPGLDPLRAWAAWVTTTHDDYPTPPQQHDPVLYHVTAGYGIDPAQLSFTGPVRFSTLRLALAGDVLDVPLGDSEAPVITETKSELTFTPPANVIEVAAILPGPVARVVAEGKALNSRGVDWVAEHCGTEGAAWADEMRARAGEIEAKRAEQDGIEVKRDVSADERDKLRKQGHTLDKDSTSYPIKHLGDLDNAITSAGRAKPGDRGKLKRHLKSEAHRLDAPQHMHDRIDSLDPDGDGDDDRKKEGKSALTDDIEVKIASPDPRAVRIRNMWAHDPKLTRKWRPGTPGDFKRLRRHLAKYVHTPRILNGLTANIHKLATGEWPGKKAHTGKGNVGKAMNMGRVVTGKKSLVDWSDVEYKAVLAPTDAELVALFEGIEAWGEVFTEPWTNEYLAALDDADETPAEGDETPSDLEETARLTALGSRLVVDESTVDAGEGSDQLPNLFDEPVGA